MQKNIESFASKIKDETVAISTYFRLNDVIESGLLAEHFFSLAKTLVKNYMYVKEKGVVPINVETIK